MIEICFRIKYPKNIRLKLNKVSESIHTLELVSRGGGGVLIYISVRIMFRILTPGQGVIFVEIGSMTGSIFVIFYSDRSF